MCKDKIVNENLAVSRKIKSASLINPKLTNIYVLHWIFSVCFCSYIAPFKVKFHRILFMYKMTTI